jgi:hypothetical protein
MLVPLVVRGVDEDLAFTRDVAQVPAMGETEFGGRQGGHEVPAVDDPVDPRMVQTIQEFLIADAR